MEQIKIVLVDDHVVVRDGIKALINSMKNTVVIAEASNEKELFAELKINNPDLVILDISLPGKSGIEIAKELQSCKPQVKVMILSMYTDEDFIFSAIKAGAKGYLSKNTSKKELQQAINDIAGDGEYFSEPISNIILKSYIKKAREDKSEHIQEMEEELSQREMEVLKLFAEGKSNQEIADSLCISIRTVESHKTHIMKKLKLKNIVDLIKFAIRNNIINLYD